LTNRLLAAAAFALALPLSAQSPYLVKDINPTPVAQFLGAEPEWFTSFGGAVYFSGWTAATGREMFRYSGGTVEVVKDIQPGIADSNPGVPVQLGEVLLFGATSASGHELWQTDGTSAGTTLLKDIHPTGSSNVSVLAVVGTRAVLLADDGTHAAALWYTDGTAAGTQFLAETNPDSVTLDVIQTRTFGGRVYIAHPAGLWTTDGTIAGTVKLSSGVCSIVGAVGSNVLFRLSGSTTGGGALWKTDGTLAGTMLVQNVLVSRPRGITPTSALATAQQWVFFVFNGAEVSLWKTDGSGLGTQPVRFFPEYSSSTSFRNAPSPIAYELGIWWFDTPEGLWRSDGTTAGTYQVTTQHATSLVGAFSKVYFLGRTGGFWSSDGTAAGTTRVKWLTPYWSGPLTKIGETLYFGGDDGTTGVEPWISEDGTAAGTHLLTNMNPEPPSTPGWSSPMEITAAGDVVHFTTWSQHKLPLYLLRSDGTDAGTVQNLRFSDYGFIRPLGVWSGGAYFEKRNHANTQAEIWRSDASGATLAQLFDFEATGTAVTTNALLVTESTKRWIWAIGNDLKAVPLTDADGKELLNNSGFAVVGGHAYFSGRFPDSVTRTLYRTAGTAATTEVVIPVYEGSVLGGAGGFIFTDCSGALCRLGTPPQVIVLSSLTGGWGGDFVAAGNYVYFRRSAQLWRTDGTAAGTFPLTDGIAGPLTAVGNLLFFMAADANGEELWRTDGTVSGTSRVADINPGPASSQPSHFAAADGMLWFRANDGLSGVELWRSDGTAAGTVLVADLQPGSASSTPTYLTVAGRRLFFAAETAATGRELWAITLAAPPVLDARGSATAVRLTWTAYTAAAPVTYDVYRASGSTTFAKIGTVSTTQFSDTAVTANNTYFYRVIGRGANGAVSPFSNTDLASTRAFTDDPLMAKVTRIKAAHVNELRAAVNAARAAAGLPPFAFSTAPTIGALVRGTHVTELRTALTSVFTALSTAAPVFTDASIAAGNPIRAVHIQELRNALK
jgi:ELWxxDGT repeat protein